MSSRTREATQQAAEYEAERERIASALENGEDPHADLGPAELAALVRRR